MMKRESIYVCEECGGRITVLGTLHKQPECGCRKRPGVTTNPGGGMLCLLCGEQYLKQHDCRGLSPQDRAIMDSLRRIIRKVLA